MAVSDEEIEKAFKGTNFGHTNYRELLNRSVLKSYWITTADGQSLAL